MGGTPNDSDYGDQWALPKIGWDNVYGTTSPGGSAKVAILDTGVDGSHSDLNVVAGTSILDGSDGQSDPNGHGTAMAGIVAARTNNASGIAGVGFAGVQVMPVTVLGSDGTGQDSDIIEGVVYAAEHDADVILMAFSNPGYSELLQAAIDYAWDEGVVLVAAAGNDSSSSPQFPAGDRGVIGVSNTDQSDALASSSNSGQAVFLGAPGTSIVTTDNGGGTTTISGTSASAAHVAGAAALIKAASGAANGVIVSRLARNAEAAGTRDQTGNGRLNLDRAIADTSTASVQPAGRCAGCRRRPLRWTVCSSRTEPTSHICRRGQRVSEGHSEHGHCQRSSVMWRNGHRGRLADGHEYLSAQYHDVGQRCERDIPRNGSQRIGFWRLEPASQSQLLDLYRDNQPVQRRVGRKPSADRHVQRE